MSHTGGGHHCGHHGVQGGQPDQSAAWNSALQGGDKPITSLPNPTILPIFFALVVFVIMLLPFIINWGDGGVEVPWVHKPSRASQAQEQAANNAPPANYEQQLLYASQQSYAQNANQQTQVVNPSAQQSYEGQQNYAAQPNYSQMGYPQENYGQNYAPMDQQQNRHRVWVER